MKALGFDLRSEAALTTVTSDVITSSAIEGESLDPEQVRSSVARHLGLDTGGRVVVGRDVEGIVEVMTDATRRYSEPLTAERLFSCNAALFPTGRSSMHKITVGPWRTDERGPMRILSGPMGRYHSMAAVVSRMPRQVLRPRAGKPRARCVQRTCTPCHERVGRTRTPEEYCRADDG